MCEVGRTLNKVAEKRLAVRQRVTNEDCHERQDRKTAEHRTRRFLFLHANERHLTEDERQEPYRDLHVVEHAAAVQLQVQVKSCTERDEEHEAKRHMRDFTALVTIFVADVGDSEQDEE